MSVELVQPVNVEALKPTVEDYLNHVDYEFQGYMPTEEALRFVNFIKAVNGGEEENKTPIVHLVMMERVFNEDRRCAIMCHRGIGKTTLFAEYLILYIAAFGVVPGFGKVNLLLYVTDSIENGVKNLRRNVEYRYQESEFLQHIIPNQNIKVGTDGEGFVDLDSYEEQVAAGGRKFTDIRLEFMNNKGHRLVVKGYGAKALSLDTRVYTRQGYTTIGQCEVGQEIYGPDGELAQITAKSEIFNKPMYRLELEDGRFLKVSEDHINSVMVNTHPNGTANWVDADMTTKQLIDFGWIHTKKGNLNHKGISNKCIMKIRNTEPLEYPTKIMGIDPYTLGLVLGDGSIKKKASGIVLTGDKEDMDFYRRKIPHELGEDYLDKRTENVITYSVKGINQIIRDFKLDVHGRDKFIPEQFFFGDIRQRLNLLQGLLDTDGSISGNGRITFVSASEKLVDDTARLVRSLGGKAKKRELLNAWLIEIWVGMNPFKLLRKAERYVHNRRNWNTVNVVNVERIEDEPSQCIAIDNEDHQFLAGEYFRTHNTGVRGAKEMGQRPQMAILDDLISDEDARSATIVETIENTIYKAVSKALHPTKQKMVFIGTPFNANDPLYKAVESGAWTVSVFPICEKFPVTEEEFRGSWEDRFTYEYVKAEYDEAIALHKPENFNQELMLRIMSEEDRLIQDDDIVWFSRRNVLQNKGGYNFYITTDFATSAKKGADYSVLSVWAYNSNGDWMLVDGVCQQQLMDQNMKDLFRLVSMYRPLSVGVEVTGQQGGFIRWINNEMVDKNIFFNLASSKNSGEPGIRPSADKLTRFNQVLPLFKAKKIWVAQELKDTAYGRELVDELTNVSKKGFKSRHDDVSDTISMLSEIDAYKPTADTLAINEEFNVDSGVWADFTDEEDFSGGSTVF